MPPLDAASSTGTRAIPWANRGCEVGDSAAATSNPLSPVAIEERSRHRLGSPRGVDVAFGRRDDRALHEDVPGVGEGNGVMNAGFLGQAPHDRPDVLEVRDAGPTTTVALVTIAAPNEASSLGSLPGVQVGVLPPPFSFFGRLREREHAGADAGLASLRGRELLRLGARAWRPASSGSQSRRLPAPAHHRSPGRLGDGSRPV